MQPFTTGIQRVVRCLAKEWMEGDFPNLKFVSFDGKRFKLLKQAQLDSLVEGRAFFELNVLTRKKLLAKLYTLFYVLYFSLLGKTYLHGFLKYNFSTWIKKLKNYLFDEDHSDEAFSLLQEGEEKTEIFLLEIPSIEQICVYRKAKSISYSMLLYDLIPIMFPDYLPSSNVACFMAYVSLLPGAKKLLCISDETKRQVKDYFTLMGRESPILETHLLAASSLISKTLVPPEAERKKKVLCICTIEPRKNHLKLMEAAEILWAKGLSFDLELIGRDGWGSKEILAKIEELETENKPIVWKGKVSNEELVEAYSQCHFTVFPSFVEGFGLPILESLQNGKPCITSNVGSMREIAEKAGGCLLVNPHSAQEIAQAMKTLLTDDSKYKELQEQALALKWPSWADLAQSIYQSLQSTPQLVK